VTRFFLAHGVFIQPNVV